MSKFKVGIIGTGSIARNQHIPAWAALPDVEIVGVADLAVERAQAVADTHRIPHVFADYRKLLRLELDAVDICTPNRLHTPIGLAALRAGRHVLCEKPLAVTAREVRQLGELADRRGLKLMTAQFQRFTAPSRAVKQRVDAGGVGDVYHARVRAMRRALVPVAAGFIDGRLSGGGPCMDIGVHALDLCLWLMGFPKPVRVSGVAQTNFAHGDAIPGQWGEWDRAIYSVEDFAAGLVHFENGATLMLETAWLGHQAESEDMSCQLFGKKGGAKWPSAEYFTFKERLFSQETLLVEEGGEKPFAAEIRAFYEAVVHDRPSPVPWTETVKVIGILEAIYASQRRGREIRLK